MLYSGVRCTGRSSSGNWSTQCGWLHGPPFLGVDIPVSNRKRLVTAAGRPGREDFGQHVLWAAMNSPLGKFAMQAKAVARAERWHRQLYFSTNFSPTRSPLRLDSLCVEDGFAGTGSTSLRASGTSAKASLSLSVAILLIYLSGLLSVPLRNSPRTIPSSSPATMDRQAPAEG